MDKFNHRFTVVILALAFILQIICFLHDWSDLSNDGAVGRAILIILNGLGLIIVGTLKD